MGCRHERPDASISRVRKDPAYLQRVEGRQSLAAPKRESLYLHQPANPGSSASVHIATLHGRQDGEADGEREASKKLGALVCTGTVARYRQAADKYLDRARELRSRRLNGGA